MQQMTRLLALAGVALVAAAGPAWAHEEISPSSVPTGRPAYLILSAANEKRVDLTKVTVTAPANGRFGHATRDPAGWTGNLTHTVITWTGGAVKTGRFEQFGFDVEAIGQPGTLVYRVNLAYADGTSSDVDVALVAVTDGSAPPVTTPATPATTVAGGGATTTIAEHGHDEGEEEAAAASGSDGGAEGRANLALGLSILAVVGAIAAFFAGRRSAPPGSAAGPAKPAAGGGQDW